MYGIISTDDILLTNIMPFTRHKKQLMNQWIWGESRQRQSPNEDEGSDKSEEAIDGGGVESMSLIVV